MSLARSFALPLALALAAPGARALQEAPATPPRVELLDHRHLALEMNRLEGEHIGLVTVLPVGQSRAGRQIDALRIAAGERVPGRPAILLVANLDGPAVYTSGLALDHARALARGYGADARITELLDTTTVYVVPRANPDAAEARFRSPLREVRATGHGVDQDRDGRSGEDGPDDVDGDGVVTTMRVLDPDGRMVADAADSRVLVEAARAKGERGEWRVWPEGRDDDGDEAVAEDPEHDAEVNRNFPYAFEEHEPAAGRYATDEPECLALVEFVRVNPDIALVVTYGEQHNLGGKPDVRKGGRRGDEPLGVYEDDADWLKELASRYAKATDGEVEETGYRAGTFQAWAYHHRGLPSLAIKPFEVPAKEAKKKGRGAPAGEDAAEEAGDGSSKEEQEDAPEPSADARRLAWLEAEGVADAFVPWTPYEHPELGPVEVGGFRPYALVEPPPARLDALADAHLDFLLGLGDALPRLRVANAEAQPLAAGLVELTAALENDALIPFQTAAARANRAVRPARVRLAPPPGAELVAGRRQQLVSELAAAGGREELRWLLRWDGDPAAVRIELDSDGAGRASVAPEVVR